MKSIIFLYVFLMLGNINAQELIKHELDSKQTQEIIKDFEPFFKEAFVQQMESFKLKKDSITGLSYIDFCEYPPDRSLVFGALENGRFKGEKINDLPFPCDESSGARKYFIYNKDIEQSFIALKKSKFLDFIAKNLPLKNEIIQSDKGKITTLWQKNNTKNKDLKRLWILYRNEALGQSRTIIFTQKGTHTEAILQYLNYQ